MEVIEGIDFSAVVGQSGLPSSLMDGYAVVHQVKGVNVYYSVRVLSGGNGGVIGHGQSLTAVVNISFLPISTLQSQVVYEFPLLVMTTTLGNTYSLYLGSIKFTG